MLSKSLIILSSFLATVLAIQVNTPAKDAQLDLSKTNEITWSSVSTDPATFEIVLVDQATMANHVIAQSVNTADGKYSFSNLAVASGSQYRINFVSNTPNNSGILAQSQAFSIKTGGETESSKSITSASTSTGSSMSTPATTTTSSASLSTTATTGSLTSIPVSASKSTASTTTSAASASGSSTSKTSSASTGNSIRAVVSATLAGISLVLVTLLV